MKRVLALASSILLLVGCGRKENCLSRALQLREALLGKGCSFIAQVTADYGDKVYSFTMECSSDTDGNLQFTVVLPESIAGITGSVSSTGGKLTFDSAVLAFDLLADGEVSPVSAPWLLLHTLRSGYLSTAVEEDSLLHVTVDDSYEEDALQLDVWLDQQNVPQSAEILWQGRRVLTLIVGEFQFM